jgi:AcrR family transcriptional regulator
MGIDRQVRKYDAAATKEALLTAARRVFAQRGFDRTTVRDIAKLAGVNQALVFRYFGSKEELFRAVMNRAGHEQLAATQPERLLEAALRSMLDPDNAEVSAHTLLAFVRSVGNDSAATAAGVLGREYVRALATLTDADNADLRADLALAWLVGIGLLRNVAGTGHLAEADPDEICALVLGATTALLERTDPVVADGRRSPKAT